MTDALTLGCLFSDRIEALLDGRVAVAGHALDLRVVEAQRLFRSVLRGAAFDVAELSMASHIAAIGRGARDYVGVPVFPSRSFRHGNLFVRTDRIHHPGDLAGRRIGLIDFQQTAALWLRGILADEYGVDRACVEWVTGGLHSSMLEDRAPGDAPPGLRITRSIDTLDAMLRSGAIDAVISPTTPRCVADPDVPVARMWPHPVAIERDYWRRTGIFPIMHLLVVRRSLVEAEPTLPQGLYQAFEGARQLAAADLATRDFAKIALPWLSAHAADVHDALDGDPWSYGLDANRGAIETMLRYAQADGLTTRRLEPAALFA